MAVAARKRHRLPLFERLHAGSARAGGLDAADGGEWNAELLLERLMVERARRRHDEFVLLAALRRIAGARSGHEWQAIEVQDDPRSARGREMRRVGGDAIRTVDRRGRSVRREPAPLAQPRNGMRESVAMLRKRRAPVLHRAQCEQRAAEAPGHPEHIPCAGAGSRERTLDGAEHGHADDELGPRAEVAADDRRAELTGGPGKSD